MIAWIRACFASSKKLAAIILALGLTATVFSVGLMFVAGYLISASADNIYSILVLNLPLAFVQIFGLGKPIARYVERLESHDWVLRLTSNLRRRLFLAVQVQVRGDHRLKTGEVLGSLASDIEQVQNLFLRTVFPILISWLSGLLLVIIAGFASPLLFVFAGIMMVVLCVLLPLLSLCIQRAKIVQANNDRDQLYATLTDSVLGAQDVAIAGRGEQVTAAFLQRFEKLHKRESALERGNRLRLLVVQVLLWVSLLVCVLWAAEALGGVHGGSANWIAAVALGFFPLIEVFASLSQQFENGLSQKESLERLSKRGFLSAQEHSVPASAQPQGCDIALDQVSFSHDGITPVFENLSLTIPQGQKLGVLGRSGSGKTTLIRLIHGDLEPSAGSISFGGIPVARMRDQIWNHVGLISQDIYIFAMSIFDNLRLGKIEVSESEAWAALDAVGLKSYVEGLPDRLETMADEAGLRFSGGQKQRLALARVLLQNPEVVILDEPTVGLDPMSEQLVLDTVNRAFAGKTVVMVTHHLQGLEKFDRVVFLEEGQLIMDGSPKHLAQENERYAKLLAFDTGI